MTVDQANAFLESLRPFGSEARLTTHTGLFFAACVGELPTSAYDFEHSKKLALCLRELADTLERPTE